MPNAARLTAAATLAILAFIVSGQIMPLMPEGTAFGYFTPINMAIGITCGWIAVGPRMGRGWTSAVNVGLTGAFLMVFWGIFVQAANEMTRLAMRNRYDGPFEAIIAVFQIGAEYALIMGTTTIIGTLVGGGIITGLAAEYSWRKWN